jgi:hypothetical protein
VIFFKFGDQMYPSWFHKKILCDKIPAFKEELKRLGPDGTVLEFPEGMATTMEALVEFCYKDKLPEVTKTTSPEDCYIRIKLYCLAEHYGQVNLMNDSITFLIRYLKKGLPRWDVKWCSYVYQNTAPGSNLRVLISKWFLHKLTATKSKGRWTTDEFFAAASTNLDLVHDVFSLMRDNQVAENPRKEKSKTYRLTPSSTVSPEPQVDVRMNTPAESEAEVVVGQEDESDSDFAEEEEEEESSDDEELPRTRSGRKRKV